MGSCISRGPKMKKVLMITDSYNWATYFRAVNLKENLKNYDFTIRSFHDKRPINYDNFDVVYITNWPIYGFVKDKISRNRSYKLVTGVSSHIGRKSANQMEGFFSKFDSVGLSNMFLLDEFENSKIKNLVYTPFGVNHNIFNKKTNPSDYKHVFGWVGNKSRPVKRYLELKSAIRSLGPKYKFKTVGNTNNFSREKMAKFYNSIGTLICYSESEGTPNPVLEAAMCGRPIISTNVGNVPELMSEIVDFRPVNSEKSLINQIVMYGNKKDLNKLGSSIESVAKNHWTWEVQSKRFIRLFE